MDEEPGLNIPVCPWPIEDVNDDYAIVRSVIYSKRVKVGKKRLHPSPAAFILKKRGKWSFLQLVEARK